MTAPVGDNRWFDHGWLLMVVIASSIAIVAAGAHVGATFDEPFYIAKGLERWRSGSYHTLMRAGTMPLPVDFQTLPLYLWERERGQPFEPYRDLEQLLPVARAANLPFWWLLLVYGFRLGNLWGGPRTGRLASGLLACEPNLLAHAGLATTDISVTAAVLMAAYYFQVGRHESWRRRVLLPGLGYGLALLCKASSMMFVPAIFLTIGLLTRKPVLEGEQGEPRQRSQFRSLIRDLLVIGVIGFVVMFAYVGCGGRAEPSFIKWADSRVDGTGVSAVRWLARNLTIFPNAGEGLVQQIKHNIRGHGCYVLGEWHSRAVWYYFPVVLSAKLTEPLLAVLLIAAVWRPRSLASTPAAITVVLFLLSLSCRVQIGVRLVFPLVAFLVLLAASACRAVPGLAVIALLASLGIAASHWPDGLSYCNRFWGGSIRSSEVFTDSNHDWGQGLPVLREWLETTGEPTIHVWYYGADPAILRPPFQWVALQHEANPSVDALRQRVGRSYLAVADSILTGCPDRRPETLAVIDWLKNQPMAARVGNYRVYRWN